jgi:hypothetical protein
MKKMILIFAALTMVVGLSGNASALLDDNSVDNSTNANASNDISNNATIINNGPADINNNGRGYRGFASQNDMNYPGTPAFFGPTTKGPMFQDVESMIAYKNVFTVAELEKMSKDGVGMGFLGTKVIVTPLVDRADDSAKSEIMVVLMEKPDKATLKGYITVKATNDGKVSAEVMAEAMLAARELGANAIQVSAQGVERVMKAFGWGVGLAYTRATISADEAAGGVASGGTGIAGGEAGYKDRPWIQIFAIEVE